VVFCGREREGGQTTGRTERQLAVLREKRGKKWRKGKKRALGINFV
jgi:hypothetical protein